MRTLSTATLAAAIVACAALTGCVADDGETDDGPLTLHAYAGNQPGVVLLRWTGGPSGYQRWEYSGFGPGYSPGEWQEASPRKRTRHRELVLKLEPSGGYEFKIRVLGDGSDPAETNPSAVARIAAPGIDARGNANVFVKPLAPGRRFLLGYYGVTLTTPPEGTLLIAPWTTCPQILQLDLRLPTADGEARAYAELWLPPVSADLGMYEDIVDVPEWLVGRSYEFPVRGMTVREHADNAETPGERAAYRLLTDAIESMFDGYPPVAPDTLEKGISWPCG